MDLREYVLQNQEIVHVINDRHGGTGLLDKYFGTLDFATARFHTILIKLSQDSVLAIENKTAIQECFDAIQSFYKYTKKFQDTRVPLNFIYTPILHFIGKTRIPKIKSLLKKLDN